jgi:hypothetical protein
MKGTYTRTDNQGVPGTGTSASTDNLDGYLQGLPDPCSWTYKLRYLGITWQEQVPVEGLNVFCFCCRECNFSLHLWSPMHGASSISSIHPILDLAELESSDAVLLFHSEACAASTQHSIPYWLGLIIPMSVVANKYLSILSLLLCVEFSD